MNSILSSLPRIDLARLPTPLQPLEKIGKHGRHKGLFLKRDDLSGPIYGGNKIRKLEFLLGEAVERKCKSVITYGAAGSNHALATAICCKELGLKAYSLLAPQESSEHVRKNILRHYAAGAKMILCSHYEVFPEATKTLVEQCTKNDGIAPYVIPAGGTNVIGAMGYVSAAFELKKQLNPDVIYLPMGTGGTHAGLLVGLKLAGLKTKIEAIRVTHPMFKNEKHIKLLCDQICQKLGIQPIIEDSDIIIRNEFFGEGYGIATSDGKAAVELFSQLENVYLENTYTGKTAAALLHDLTTGCLADQTVLYWNTLNSRDLSKETAPIEYHALPPEFHPYFCS